MNPSPLSSATTGAARPDGTDVDLARRIAAGDVHAFEGLLRRFNRSLYRVARAILKDETEAEDVIQEALLRAYRSMATFRGDARLSTWLVRIVANEALGRLRLRSRRSAVVTLHPDAPDLAEFDPPADEAPMSMQHDPERTAMRSEMRRLLEARIDALPDAFRAVFVLRGLEELNVEETATCLGIPPATVRSRFFRARSLLRESLSREIDRAYEDAFEFGGHRCDRITANVLARIAAANAPPG